MDAAPGRCGPSHRPAHPFAARIEVAIKAVARLNRTRRLPAAVQ